jgi:hypothetical protein
MVIFPLENPLEIITEIFLAYWHSSWQGHSTPLITSKTYVKDNVKRQKAPMARMAQDF